MPVNPVWIGFIVDIALSLLGLLIASMAGRASLRAFHHARWVGFSSYLIVLLVCLTFSSVAAYSAFLTWAFMTYD
jgi:hypothetical protein